MAISAAIGQLEQGFHLGPFACVLDQGFFNAVQTPDVSLVLPQDRILPFLGGGALMRSSVLPPSTGLVIALGGEPIDLVVATDISVCFLQVTTDPYFVFRVYEKIVLRVKQPAAIAVLHLQRAGAAAGAAGGGAAAAGAAGGGAAGGGAAGGGAADGVAAGAQPARARKASRRQGRRTRTGRAKVKDKG
jgi:hypothetical protein